MANTVWTKGTSVSTSWTKGSNVSTSWTKSTSVSTPWKKPYRIVGLLLKEDGHLLLKEDYKRIIDYQ